MKTKEIPGKQIRVCLIAPVPPPYGGIGNWVLMIMDYVKKRDDIVINILNTAPVGRGIDGRTLWERIVTQSTIMFKLRKELINSVRQDRPDVIHITTSGQMAIIRDIVFLKTARLLQIPTVYHIHFGRIKEIAQMNSLEWKLISKAMKLASKVMTLDNMTYQTIKEYMPLINVVNVPNPIELFDMPKPINCNNRTIMYLGWVIKTKGIEELLVAWDRIHKRHNDWTLRLVGPYEENYKKKLEAKFPFDGVIFYGERSHNKAMEILNNSDIFVLPSYTEGFPNVILEAMALSKPIIASRVGAVPEILSSDSGILIEPKKPTEIEAALDDLINNPLKRLYIGQNAMYKLKKEYTLDRVFEKYINEWRSICVY